MENNQLSNERLLPDHQGKKLVRLEKCGVSVYYGLRVPYGLL